MPFIEEVYCYHVCTKSPYSQKPPQLAVPAQYYIRQANWLRFTCEFKASRLPFHTSELILRMEIDSRGYQRFTLCTCISANCQVWLNKDVTPRQALLKHFNYIEVVENVCGFETGIFTYNHNQGQMLLQGIANSIECLSNLVILN